MAGTSLLALLDDIATLLDDISLLTKVAAKKTTGVLGDDLALNAEQVSGIRAERELPVVWAVAKGSLVNKLILVPAALAISAFIPWVITPLLMLGGAFLCYEGFEKIFHKLSHRGKGEASHTETLKLLADPAMDPVAFERARIKGAIRTDFVLSAEIIVIALGVVKGAEFAVQVTVVSLIALAITVLVYGLVAGIVKIDDAGLRLLEVRAAGTWGDFRRAVGRLLLRFAPRLMKILTIVGTAAMFLVGGGILLHGLPWTRHLVEWFDASGGLSGMVMPLVMAGVVGLVAGGVVFALVSFSARLCQALTGGKDGAEKGG